MAEVQLYDPRADNWLELASVLRVLPPDEVYIGINADNQHVTLQECEGDPDNTPEHFLSQQPPLDDGHVIPDVVAALTRFAGQCEDEQNMILDAKGRRLYVMFAVTRSCAAAVPVHFILHGDPERINRMPMQNDESDDDW
jgi:hypothetical protein